MFVAKFSQAQAQAVPNFSFLDCLEVGEKFGLWWCGAGWHLNLSNLNLSSIELELGLSFYSYLNSPVNG